MRLRDLATTYIDFMRNLGAEKSDEKAFSCFSNVFAEDVKKIENGALIVQGLPALREQLDAVRAAVFPWAITALQEGDVTVDESRSAAVVFFGWEAKGIGQHLTAVKLDFADDKIICLTEVFTKRSKQEQSQLQK